MTFPAFLDACALIPINVTDVLLRLADFLPRDLRAHGVVAAHPDAFLLDLLDDRPVLVALCLHETVSARKRPPETADSFLIQLAEVVPGFAEGAQRLPLPRHP
ncbi:hypothetical protein OOZ19_28880 [Saccharopolyspora sp. NFXS83]|uniref:hypothetical protein n=1 Tax=Saccharopolyspora sp. NFXS83 TaxID=2993560 RepID=UPI00224B8E97|nr:hypothetical protein [Saccharopolyspora sp. NFXS83]MCX2734277.1 hypothetical protein [Saccharopolyspora sp. NFXS83]